MQEVKITCSSQDLNLGLSDLQEPAFKLSVMLLAVQGILLISIVCPPPLPEVSWTGFSSQSSWM